MDKETLFDALPLPYALLDAPLGEDGGISEIICRYHNEEYSRIIGMEDNEALSRYFTSLMN